MMKRVLTSITITFILTVFLAGCGFHARTTKDLPSELHQLNLKTPNPYSSFTSLLTNLFESLNVKLTEKAPVTLDVRSVDFTYNQPEFTTTTQAVTYTYQFTSTFVMMKNDKRIAGPYTLTTTRDVIMNVNQIYAGSSTKLAQRELEREMVTLIYNKLISNEVKTALKNSRG